MDYYEDEAPKKGFTVWKLIKWLLLLLTITVYLLLTLRACALEGLKDTAKTRKLLWNETSLSAYNASPDTFSVYKNSTDSIVTNDGTITVTNIHWLQSAGQLQLTVRYNDSLARTIEDEFSLDAEPTGEYLTFALRDDLGHVYTAFEYVTDEAFIYNFRRLVFDGVKLDGSSILNLEVYYTGYVDYNNTSAPLNSITVYNASDGLEPYELKNSELPKDGISANLNSSKVWTTATDDSDTENN